MTYYKFLKRGGESVYVRGFRWSLPTKNEDGTWTPGEWMPKVKRLELCGSGYHVCTIDQMWSWVNVEMYETEVRGAHLDDDDKSCWQEARLLRRVETWNERTPRLLACDYAARVLPIFENKYPGDKRLRQAIGVTQRYVNGNATRKELSAEWDIATADMWEEIIVVKSMAWLVVRRAMRVAADDVISEVLSIARDVMWYAGWAIWKDLEGGAGIVAAKASERKWQIERLRQYLEGDIV